MAAFTISHTDGSVYTTVGEGVVDTSLGISLIGQNYTNYGQLIANNFLQLLENQSNATQPLNPQQGQLWWNSATKVLSVFDGQRFKPCAVSSSGSITPVLPKQGDQWWDTNTDQLKIYNGTTWVIVGPLYQKGQLFSGILPETVADNNGVSHSIASIQLDGETVMVVSKDPTFYMPTGHEINGLTTISPGLVLTSNTTVAGTAANALKLGNLPASEYVTTVANTSVINGSITVANDLGITIGADTSLLSITKNLPLGFLINSDTSNVTIRSGSASVNCLANGAITVSNEPTVAKSITTKGYVDTAISTADSSLRNYVDAKTLAFTGNSIIPTLAGVSTAINNDPNFYANNLAQLSLKAPIANPTLTGTPRAPTPAAGDSSTRIATTAFVQQLFAPLANDSGILTSGDILPVKDFTFNVGSPSYRFKTLYGNAMTANYADLAEIYTTDAIYKAGTVVVFGGKEEVTISDQQCDTRVAGVISTNPAYLMNDASKGQAVALSGKVPCKVAGPVKKGDLLVNSRFAGVATAIGSSKWAPGCTIGKSLEDNNNAGIRDVMIAVGRF